MNSGEGKAEEGKNIMKWGLIALFVMISVWGIIGFFQRALGIELNTTQNAPTPGILPSRGVNPLLWPASQPTPGVLPARGNNPLIDPSFKGPAL